MIGATIFLLDTATKGQSIKDLLREIARDVADEYPDKYEAIGTHRAVVGIRDSRVHFPQDKQHCRYRTIAANAVRLDGGLALEFCVANRFEPEPSTSGHPGYDKWRNNASRIEWPEHIERVRDFVLDAEDAGWLMPLAEVRDTCEVAVNCINGDGVTPYRPKLFSHLARQPLRAADGISLKIVDMAGVDRSKMEAPFRQALAASFVGTPIDAIQVSSTPTPSPLTRHEMGLLVVSSRWTPAANDLTTKYIAEMEQAGHLFRICQDSTLSNGYARNNIAFTLFKLAGGVPWSTELRQHRRILALDAGHDAERRRSQWCAASLDTETEQIEIHHTRVGLREDLTEATVNRLLEQTSSGHDEVWRDGKWHKHDRTWFESDAVDSSFHELVKNPRAVLFRGSLEDPSPPAFGDCVQLDRHHWLLQSLEASGLTGYSRPLRLRGAVDEDQVHDILALTKRPLDSLSHSSRLPSPMFWADRASKLSISGWMRAVGHGWQLPCPLDEGG